MNIPTLMAAGSLSAVLTGAAGGAHPSVPDLVCRADSTSMTVHVSLRTVTHISTDMYRFRRSKLYLSSADREEYFYGDVAQVDPLRFTSGYKTILFSDSTFRRAIVVHVDDVATRILRVRCVAA